MPGDSMNEKGKYYLTLSPPYRAAHRMMVSASELQLIEGMTPALYTALAPYIAALPTVAPVNVQTASAPVLASLSESMTLETGKAIEQIRQQQNFPTIEAFLNLDIMKNHKISADKITILSQYFLVETTVKIEKQKVVLYTLLERIGKDGKSTVNVVWQSKGVMG
jgi:general secretion pathway protein K